MANILILGPNSGIGQNLIKHLVQAKHNLNYVVRVKDQVSSANIFWDYSSPLPTEFNTFDIVINCARSPNFNDNIKFNKRLITGLSPSVKLINFSSNCVFAQPQGKLTQWLFKGDAYIREKNMIEKLALGHSNITLLRPTIVADEGSWMRFIKSAQTSHNVFAPDFGEGSRVNVITTDEVSSFIVELIESQFSQDIPPQMFTQNLSVEEFLGIKLTHTPTKHTYFNSPIKNMITLLLTSVLMPDFFAFKIQAKMTRNKVTDTSATVADLHVEGMTRLYLFGQHTL